MMTMREPFRWSQVGGRDIYFDARCNCQDRDLPILQHKVKLAGYADANFFDNVNSKPTDGECKCGRRYRYQWFRDGVAFEWIDDGTIAEGFAAIRRDLAEIVGGQMP